MLHIVNYTFYLFIFWSPSFFGIAWTDQKNQKYRIECTKQSKIDIVSVDYKLSLYGGVIGFHKLKSLLGKGDDLMLRVIHNGI